jgi:hypothetical protein
MTSEIKTLIDQMKVNKINGQYAVYKPLLLLIIFSKVLRGQENCFEFKTISSKLERLMEKHGWHTFSPKKAQYPFYFLASSALWELNVTSANFKHPDAPSKKEMENAVGRLNERYYKFLVDNPMQTETLINYVKSKFFSRDVNLED